MNEHEKYLKEIAEIVEKLGFECVHVGIRRDYGRLKIQVLMDSLGGINVDECEQVSKRINKYLDENDELPELKRERYYLEVSSPGIERPLYELKDYERFQGREARIRLSKLQDGRKNFTGIIKYAGEGIIKLQCEDEEKQISFEDIKGGNLVYRFENENESNSKKSNKKRRKK